MKLTLDSVSQDNPKFKKIYYPLSRYLSRFSNNLIIKSLVDGFGGAAILIMIASIFVFSYALPEIFVPNLASKNAAFANYKYYAHLVFSFTYGMIGVFVCGHTAKSFAIALNEKLPLNRKINPYTIFMCAICSYLIMAIAPVSLIPIDFQVKDVSSVLLQNTLGAQGVFPGLIIGAITAYIFYWSYKYNITIRVSKSMPEAISQAFLIAIPFFLSILLWSGLGFIVVYLLGMPLIPYILNAIAVVFTSGALDNYAFIVGYKGLESLSWFIGVHPDTFQGIFEPIMASNLYDNINNGANNAFVSPLMDTVSNLGGTGATFCVPLICLLCCRSAKSKTAGKISAVSSCFQINEPILFGMPIVLNPLFIIPFVFVPIINGVIAKVFVSYVGLIPGQLVLPWATPWFIKGPVSHGFQWQIFVLLAVTFAISIIMYYPSVKVQDRLFFEAENSKNPFNNVAGLTNGEIMIQRAFNWDLLSIKSRRYCHKQLRLLNHHSEDKIIQEKITFYENEISKRNDKNQKSELKIIAFKQIYNYYLENKITYYERVKSNKIAVLNDKNIRFNDAKLLKNKKIQNKIDKYTTYEKEIGYDYVIKKTNLETKFINETKLAIPKKEPIAKYDYLIACAKLKYAHLLKKRVNLINHTRNKSLIDNTKTYKELKVEWARVNDDNIELLKQGHNFYEDPSLLEKHNQSSQINEVVKPYNILVMCIGAGTSAMLANAINKGALVQGDKSIHAKAVAYGNHKEALTQTDMIITSPQLGSYIDTIKQECDGANITLIQTKGRQYISLCNDNSRAYQLIVDNKDPSSISELKPVVKDDKSAKPYNVLVMCIGAGTSAMLANAINKGALAQGDKNVHAKAVAYGNHKEALTQTNMIITSPQLGSYIDAIKKECDGANITLIQTKGRQYISLCNDNSQAYQLIADNKDEK